MEELSNVGIVKLSKAGYYGREVEVVGEVRSARMENGETFLDLAVSGTRDQELLKVLSGKMNRMLTVHVCKDSCGQVLTGEDLIHGSEYAKVKVEDEGWYGNLESVAGIEPPEDELSRLRREAEERTKKDAEREKSPKKKKEKRKKEKKKDKEKKKRKDEPEPVASSSSEEAEEEEPGGARKSLKALFGRTGLDPDSKKRHKVTKRARRLGKGKKKKKKKDSDSKEESEDSSSGTTSGGDEGSGLFDSDRKVRLLADRCPGALSFAALLDARRQLLTAAGTSWAMEKEVLSPVFVQYIRQQMQGRLSAPMLQEALTIGTCLDAMVLGKCAFTMDVLAQRLKALEALALGTHWSIARQLEVVRSDAMTLAQENENYEALKRARDEDRMKSRMARPPAPRPYEGDGNYKGPKKGKGKSGYGKSKAGDDAGKNKGGDGRRDDRQQWQGKKDK